MKWKISSSAAFMTKIYNLYFETKVISACVSPPWTLSVFMMFQYSQKAVLHWFLFCLIDETYGKVNLIMNVEIHRELQWTNKNQDLNEVV
jgi:hypothetical protein